MLLKRKKKFNWILNIYMSPMKKRNCQKFRYWNSKYSIKIYAVWQSSQDTFSKQQKTNFLMMQTQLGSSLFVLWNKTVAWLTIWSVIHFINSNKLNRLWKLEVRVGTSVSNKLTPLNSLGCDATTTDRRNSTTKWTVTELAIQPQQIPPRKYLAFPFLDVFKNMLT